MTGRTRKTARALMAATAMMFAGLSLGGCIIVEPRHHYYGYY